MATTTDNPVRFWARVDTHLRSVKGDRNARLYRRAFSEWITFLGELWGEESAAETALRATESDAIDYVDWQKYKPGMKPRRGSRDKRAPATINLYCNIVSSFYSRLVAAGIATHNPFLRLKKPRAKKNQKFPTELIPFADVMRLINHPTDPMHRAILATMAGSALRVSEVCKLRFENVQISAEGNFFLELVDTKAGEDQRVTLPQWAVTILNDWMTIRRIGGHCGEESPIFVTGYGATVKPISVSTVQRLVKRYGKAIGQKNISSHSLRATAITKLLSDGHDYRKVMTFSRHTNIQTLDHYDKRRLTVDENPGLKLRF